MSEKSRSSSRLAVCAVLLLCAGAGAWYYTNEGFLPQEKAVQSAAPSAPVLNTASEAAGPAEAGKPAAPSTAPADAGTPSAEAQAEAQAEAAPRQVSGSLNSGPRPRQLSAEEKRDARVEEALAATSRMDGGDSASGSLSENAAQPVKEAHDPVVTPHFVSELAAWLANSYKPAANGGGLGKSAVTLRSANARFSLSPALRSAERDALKGRSAILRYVYSPGMLEALYRMYGPALLAELEDAARSGRRSFDQAQTAAMFRLYSGKLASVASALEAASRLDVPAMVKPIRQAAAQEEAASEAFAKAYAAHSEAREAGNREAMDRHSARMVQSIREASQADARKERVRQNVVHALKQNMTGTPLSDADLIFLAEWLERRKASKEAVSASASICRRLSAEMAAKAAELHSPEAVPAE
ncbi:MAG: hypothetical protein IJE96_02600 [Mailhella sp.]|nr:hypothetical protein [Mailhella sp.]